MSGDAPDEVPERPDRALRHVAAALAGAGIEPSMTEARLILELAGVDRAMLLARDGELTRTQRVTVAGAGHMVTVTHPGAVAAAISACLDRSA